MGIGSLQRPLAGDDRKRVRGVLVCYNDWPFIKVCIESIYPLVDEIVCVDGKYIDFPIGPEYSDDGTVEYLESIDKVRVIKAAGLQEVEKRNVYLEGLKEGDWFLHLDADEEWVGSLEIPDADMGIVRLRRSQPQHNMNRIRLMRYVEGLHYAKKHYWLFDSQDRTFCLLDKPGDNYQAWHMKENLIIHHGYERDQNRTWAKKNYYKVLSKRENPIREYK